MFDMNWKKFMREVELLKNWLEEPKSGSILNLLLKIILLCMLKKGEHPVEILNQAKKDCTLQELFFYQMTPCQQDEELPEEIYAIIDGWNQDLLPDSEVLGKVYERLSADKRTRGLYYTPKNIIDFIMMHTVAACDIIADPKVRILDPACGCGYFLLAAYDLLWQKFIADREVLCKEYPDIIWSDDEIHRHILTYNLWGADIDTIAVQVSAAALMLKRIDANRFPQANVLCGDSLKTEEGKDNLLRFFGRNDYDFVVGNPPYLSFGSRGTKRLLPEYESYLRKTYHASAEYKLSYYVFFMQKGLELLKPGGKLGYIVPDSFLLGRYYSKIRQYIMNQAAIEILTHVSSVIFKNAAPGYSVICVLRKEPLTAARENQIVSAYRMEESRRIDKILCCYQYPQNYFASLPFQRFRMFFDESSHHIVNKLDASGVPLGRYLSGHSGIRSLSRQHDIISAECRGNTWQRGLISGRQVLRYGLLAEEHWLNIDPHAIYKGGWYPEQVKVRKILMRQTGDTLTACIDDKGFYHLNNIHSFTLKNHDVSLDYLLLIINSRLFAFYYHVISMEYGRSMAQIDIETAELLPVCINADISTQAPELVRTMQACITEGAAGNTNLLTKAKALDAFIDQLVYRIYSLTEEEICYVEDYERKLAERTKGYKIKLNKKRT